MQAKLIRTGLATGVLVCLVGLVLNSSTLCAADSAELAGRRPNIILILSDDQGYGDLGRNGNPVIKTPHLDRMFDNSVHFEDFHVSPTCAPTRCSLMTGRHEFKSGVTHTILERERMNIEATTIAQVLKSAGYATGIFGKWHLGDEAAYQPGRRGFDEVFIHGGGGIGQTYPGTCGDAPGNTYFDPVILHNGKFEKTSGYCTDIFFSEASDWIARQRKSGPFFCYITPNAAHSPHQVPEKYAKMYADLPAPAGDDQPDDNSSATTEKGANRKGRNKIDVETARFLGMITNIDENVGRLHTQLKEWGIEQNTLVIYMNDNGGTNGCRIFNAGMKGAKVTAHNGGTRAMSLWQWPGALRAQAVDALTAHIDLFPTLAELAGAKVPPETAAKLEGFSLVPLLRDPKAAWHDDRMLFTHVGRWAQGVAPEKFGPCSVRWRQYLFFPSPDRAQLFDLKADPGEKIDEAGRHPEVVRRLTDAYDQWWTEVLACLSNENAYKTAPQANPFKALYWQQYQGPGPNNVAPADVKNGKKSG